MGDALHALLARRGTIVLDGAMATELETRGVDTSGPLWSALAMRDAPEALLDVHRTYLQAGADVATTNTYQANLGAYQEAGLTRSDAENLVREAVRLARRARDEHEAGTGRRALVAGSVGPYGAFLADGSEYTGAYRLTDAQVRDFHLPRLRLLVDEGVDVLALETMPHGGEVRALLGLLGEVAPGVPAWLSLSVSDDGAALRDGTPLSQVARWAAGCPQVRLLGVNCTDVATATTALRALAGASDLPLVVYPNSGEPYDPGTKTWAPAANGEDGEDLLARHAPAWRGLGARAVGGCCRTTPAQVRSLASAVAGSPAC